MVRGPQVNDRPFMAIDGANGALYVAYNGHLHGEEQRHDNASFRNTVALIRSDDGGATFGAPAQRALMDQTASAGSNAGMDGVVILPDGSIAVLYTHMTLAEQGKGETASPTGKPTVVGSALMLARSTDGGRTLAPPTLVARVHSGYNLAHARGITGTIAVDTGRGPHRGRLYVTWADFASGRGEILLTSSDDAGATWSPPAR
ncbi:MAG: exo-alpha-sialidase [Gemmatimonadetes bacterium]|nr:exo-alpha-sialidase [Gemmatimonadota bacterium]